eukprot:866509_1
MSIDHYSYYTSQNFQTSKRSNMVLRSGIIMFGMLFVSVFCIHEPTAKRRKQNITLIADLENVSWYSKIRDETHLFNQMYQVTQDMMHNTTSTDTAPPNTCLETFRVVLHGMLTWYEHRIDLAVLPPIFRLNPQKIQTLSHVINQAIAHPTSSNVYTFMELKVLITAFSNTDPRFTHLLHCLYHDLYTQWMSNHALQFVSKIGAGHQANVIKVQQANNGTFYALKIYKSLKDCYEESHIIQRIENEIHSENISIKVPKLISGYGITCSKHYAILMQYIDGTQVHKMMKMFTKDTAHKMWNQLSDTIIKLGSRGIGHFDLNSFNILVDHDDTFWLIDFGFGISIASDATTKDLRLLPNPIIGTWSFYSPQVYELSLLIRVASQHQLTSGGRARMNQLIIDANLYSLQALILFMSGCKPYMNQQIMVLHHQIDALWTANQVDDVTNEMMVYITKMWMIRSVAVEDYLRFYQGKPHILEEVDLNMLVINVTLIEELNRHI